jgi:protein ImuB
MLVPVAQQTGQKLQNVKCKLKTANWKTSTTNNSPSSPRPLLLYPKPQAVEVVCVAPDGPPQFLWLGQRRESVLACAGPERIETLWWRGPSVRRDYYRIAIESGSHLWIFRRLKDGRWFVHGVFA